MAKSKRSTNRTNTPASKGPAIREMELDDLPGVYRLGERLFTPEKQPNLYRTWDEYELAELFTSDGDFCLVAESGDRIVGFAMGTLIEKRRSAWKYGYLIWVGVSPRYKRHGLGTRLTERLTERFIDHGARILIVDTQKSNREALQFFKKQGFGNEIDHVYLSRNLSSHPDYLKKKNQVRR